MLCVKSCPTSTLSSVGAVVSVGVLKTLSCIRDALVLVVAHCGFVGTNVKAFVFVGAVTIMDDARNIVAINEDRWNLMVGDDGHASCV